MRIATNNVSDNIVRQIQTIGNQQSKLQTQVSTGQRIFQPEDDPTAVGRVLNLESQQRQISQYQRNSDRALEISQTSFAGLQQIKKVSDRATELGALGAGAISPTASRAYASEVDQLIEQTLQLANTRLRNDYVFAGTAVSAAPFTATRVSGQVTAVTYNGNSNTAAIPLSETASVTPQTSGTTNTQIGSFLTNLIALRTALQAVNPAGVTTAQGNLITNEDQLVTALAEHGGVQTRIEANQTQQTSLSDSLETLVSAEVDADMPSTIVKLNQAQTAYQAALQSSANIMRLSLLDYLK